MSIDLGCEGLGNTGLACQSLFFTNHTTSSAGYFRVIKGTLSPFKVTRSLVIVCRCEFLGGIYLPSFTY